jgi:hypothetical protein
VSSCNCELVARIVCFCIEDDEKFSGECDADEHFWLSRLLQPLRESFEMRIEFGHDGCDDEEDTTRPGASASHMPVAGALAAIVGEGSEACQLGDGLVGDEADLGQFGHQAGDGASGHALEQTKGPLQPGPQRIVIDHQGNLAFQPPLLALEEDQHRLDAGAYLGVACGTSTLLVDGRIADNLAKPANQRGKPLLGSAWRWRRHRVLDYAIMGDDSGVDAVGFLKIALSPRRNGARSWH